MLLFKNNTKTNNFLSYKTLFVVAAIMTCAAAVLSVQLSGAQKDLDQAMQKTFKAQLNQGKACGIITSKMASQLLGEEVVTTGSIIPSDAVSAASRRGTPRVDSCSHTSPKNAGSYIDLVIKTYASDVIAQDAYEQITQKVLFIENQDSAGFGQKRRYAAGVYYILNDTTILELSANQADNIAVSDKQILVSKILKIISEKL